MKLIKVAPKLYLVPLDQDLPGFTSFIGAWIYKGKKTFLVDVGPASTVPMLGRFARMGDAVVIPAYARFLPGGRGLEVIIDPPLDPFPSDDQAVDAAYMNRVIEARIHTMPAQYFWVHRRFKTRPPGEPPIYSRKRRRSPGGRR